MSTFALSIEMSSLRRDCASLNATRATRSISAALYTMLSRAISSAPLPVRPRGWPKYAPPVSSRTITRSVPSTTSGRSVVRSARCGWTLTGRTLAKTSISRRKLQQARLAPLLAAQVVPCRAADGTEQHRVGGLARLEGLVGQGRAELVDRSPPDQRARRCSPRASAAVAHVASTLSAALTTSGPTPSPGSTTMFAFTSSLLRAPGPASMRGVAPRTR